MAKGQVLATKYVVLTSPQERHMHIRAQPHVVRQVPSDVVGVLVDHDAVAVPEPVVAVVIVVWGDVEVVAAEPEAVPAAAGYHENMARTKAAVVVAVLPGMVEMVVNLVSPVLVADPSAILAVDVRSVGMSFTVAKAALVAVMMVVMVATVIVAVLLRSVMRNVFVVVVAIMIAVPVVIVAILGYRVYAKGKNYNKKSDEFLQGEASLQELQQPEFLETVATIAQEIAGIARHRRHRKA